jgi:hypothetical protein
VFFGYSLTTSRAMQRSLETQKPLLRLFETEILRHKAMILDHLAGVPPRVPENAWSGRWAQPAMREASSSTAGTVWWFNCCATL